ncbi:MAG: hypothetical protein U5L04_01985 [Trueperaceae bacterium]|nr:hypothetical protein [Trueperaceae bacterium]
MNEQSRILQMLEDGKISQEDAALLLDALGDTPDADTSDIGPSTEPSPEPPATPETPHTVRVTSSSSSSSGSSGTTTTSLDKDGFRMTSRHGPTPPETPSSQTKMPEVRGWVSVEVLAGNTKVTTDAALGEPVVVSRGSRGFAMSRQGDRYEVRQTQSGFGLGGVEVKIPANFGVDISSRLGNVTVRGAAAVRGRVTAGNVKVRDTYGIDLVIEAGELDITATLTRGQHRIRSQAGNTSLRLLEGSSLTLTGKMIVGEANLSAPFKLDKNSFRADEDDDTSFWVKVDKQLLGATLSGQLGDGSATLDVSLKAGNLSVRADAQTDDKEAQ